MDQSRLLQSMIVNNDGVTLVKLGDYEGAINAFTQSLEGLRPLLAVTACDASTAAASFKAYDEIERGAYDDGEMVIEDCSTSSSSLDDNGLEEIGIQEPDMKKRRESLAPSRQCLEQQPTVVSSECCGVNTSPFEGEGQQQRRCHRRQLHQQSQQHQQGGRALDQQYIFSDPIEIPSEATKAAPSQRLCSKLSMVVMYNLALSFHLSALAQGCIARLARAKKLYELAFQMHLEESCEVTLLYSLALMNNLGLVYQLLNDMERSNQCFQHLLATMMFLLESEEAHKIKQWDGLMSNVLGLIFTDHAVAAAA